MNDVTTLPHHALSPDGHAPPPAQGGQPHGLATDSMHPAQGGMAGHSAASTHHGRDKIDWSPEVWARIDAAVREEIKRSRVAARFLPTVHVPAKSTTVPADLVSATATANGGGGTTPAGVTPSGVFSVDESSTTRVNEVWVEFSLTPAQVEEEEAAVHGIPHGQHPQHQLQQHSQLHPHHHHQTHASTGMSLATRAANILAQVEDSIIFQGLNAFQSPLISGPTATVGARFLTNDLGLLNLLLPGPSFQGIPIISPPLPGDQIKGVSPVGGTVLYQEKTVAAVANAFSVLQGKGQYGPYALVLQTTPFADAHSPLPTTLITPAEPIRQLMNAGFYGTGTLPPYVPIGAGTNGLNLTLFPTSLYTGLVVSLGGNTMDLVRGRMNSDEDVIVRFEQKDANGFYRFRVIERFALRLKDITAVFQLQFLST
jgi:hypothetical protein